MNCRPTVSHRKRVTKMQMTSDMFTCICIYCLFGSNMSCIIILHSLCSLNDSFPIIYPIFVIHHRAVGEKISHKLNWWSISWKQLMVYLHLPLILTVDCQSPPVESFKPSTYLLHVANTVGLHSIINYQKLSTIRFNVFYS